MLGTSRFFFDFGPDEKQLQTRNQRVASAFTIRNHLTWKTRFSPIFQRCITPGVDYEDPFRRGTAFFELTSDPFLELGSVFLGRTLCYTLNFDYRITFGK